MGKIDLQQISITGRLGGDAEPRTVGDKEMLNLNVAANGRNDSTNWYGVTVPFGSENFAQYLKKGAEVTVTGKFSTSAKKDGGVFLNIWADSVILHGSKAAAEGDDTAAPKKAKKGAGDLPF